MSHLTANHPIFNIMAIPPSDDTYANSNTIQLAAVRHRMRLIYRPKALAELSNNTEAQNRVAQSG